MIFNIAWPVIEFFLWFSVRLLKRLWDSGLSLNRNATNKKTIVDYVELYCGPDYVIHYKYSFILNIVFITFLFGAGLPILFPIAMVSFIVLFLMERLQLAYSYKRPPMFDEKLNEAAVHILVFAPFLYLLVGFWMFNNIQIFRNDVIYNSNYNEPQKTGHNFDTMFKYGIDHSFPFFLIICLFILLLILRVFWYGALTRYFGIEKLGSLKTETLTFYQALSR